MAVSRFNIASNKKTALLKQNMRAVAVLLAEEPPKEEKARIKAEALIRDDDMIEAFEILQLECELLSERIKLIEFCKGCPPDLVSCIATLIYAAPRVDIPELQVIRKQFRAKYGKQFEEDALNNAGGVLNERVVTKLSIHPPAAFLVQTYLEKICEQFEVDWSPTRILTVDQMCEPMVRSVQFLWL
jgi:vacuolar protein sorting-associated protein IST1